MSQILRRFVVFSLFALVATSGAFAEHHESEAPSSGFRADILMDMGFIEQKVLALAEAIPAGSYSWGPAPEVRNTAASFVHLAQASHQILQALGVEPPEGVDEMEAEVTDKADVKAALEASFAAVKHAVMGLTDDDLDTMVSFFGREWPKRRVLMLVTGHAHEHLGQAIVYARSMGVVPPWSQPSDDDGGDGDGEGEGEGEGEG